MMDGFVVDRLADWLVGREERYGGYVEMEHGNGGDRMAVHGYAPAYAGALTDFVERNGSDLTLVEVGVLRGTGLAIWCDLFPRVYGLDLHPDTFRDHAHTLMAAGAFTATVPTVSRFDQRTATPESVGAVLAGPVHIVIDDGCHEDGATLRTFEAFRPHLADDFLYFVEDQPRTSRIHATLQMRPPHGLRTMRLHRSLTVITP